MYDTTALILPAGGSSTRFGQENKLLYSLKGMPVFCHSIRRFAEVLPFRNMILPVNPGFRKEFREIVDRYFPGNEIRIVDGGASRTESVWNALKALPAEMEYVAVHDAARPLASAELFCRCMEACLIHGAALAAHRVVDTVKMMEADGTLSSGSIDRGKLWAVETPQIFRFPELMEATSRAVESRLTFTDDAAAVEHFCGRRAVPVENRECNLKITYAADLVLAERLV